MRTHTKSIVCIMAMLVVALPLVAQAPKFYKLDMATGPDVPSYALPTTTVNIALKITCDQIIPGPYARYSQKYLGVIAPLAEKKIYRISDATITYTDPDTKEGKTVMKKDAEKIVSHVSNPNGFTKVSPDRLSSAERGLEDMARDAANTIFQLRKKRMELVTAEAGEHVFGAGFNDAVKELLRMEDDYLALFLGKQNVKTYTKDFEVVPEAGKANYIVCRFSQTEGVLPENDLSADPIVLVVNQENAVPTMQSKQNSKTAAYYRVAGWADCRVMSESRELARRRLPVYQYGFTVAGADK